MVREKFVSLARCAALCAIQALACSRSAPLPDRTMDVPLITHKHEPVRFEDRIRGKVVLIHFMFTTCNGICPRTTHNLVKVQELLGDHLGKDVFIESITLDPALDTADVLARYAENIGAKAGWTFFTGQLQDIDRLRRHLGLFDPDPAVDADKRNHSGVVVYGNEATGTWSAVAGLSEPKVIADAVLRVLREPRPAEMRPATYKE